MRTLIIDGDILAYQVAMTNEVSTNWGDGLWTLHCDENICLQHVDSRIEQVVHNLEADNVIVTLTGKDNFRKDVLPSYKSNRINTRKPMVLPVLREYLQDKHDAIIWKNLEADDVMGIMGTEDGSETIIYSQDKDLKTIPTYISQDGIDYELISEAQADYNFMTQTLTGDTTDGYAGLKGVGKITAEKILGTVGQSVDELWDKVLKAYERKGFTERDALQQARVARILRAGEYNNNTNEVKLWKA